jgi:hypothetical protein
MITYEDIISKIERSIKLRDESEANGEVTYYYWDGYIDALESIVDQFLTE